MKTLYYYELYFRGEDCIDGIVPEYSSQYLKLENLIKFVEQNHNDYIDLDDKLHHWDDETEQYIIIDDPSEYYDYDGEYLNVNVIYKHDLSFEDVDSSKSITIDIED